MELNKYPCGFQLLGKPIWVENVPVNHCQKRSVIVDAHQREAPASPAGTELLREMHSCGVRVTFLIQCLTIKIPLGRKMRS